MQPEVKSITRIEAIALLKRRGIKPDLLWELTPIDLGVLLDEHFRESYVINPIGWRVGGGR